jgi:hypothetical protein
MHNVSTRVHGVVYLCSKPHNLHRDDEILNLVLWWACHNAKRLYLCPSLLIIGDITNLCLISIESPLLALCCHFEIPIEDIFFDIPNWDYPPIPIEIWSSQFWYQLEESPQVDAKWK